jgi:DNA-binding winged helix-turn-helix (wHTH) protein
MASPSPSQPGSRSGVEVRVGPFEISSESCELRKLGIRIRLQPMPFRILCALVENPGNIVTRNDLRRRLWPQDTFVDFERGLNTAVNRLRLALGDSAEQPRYIETVARTGYRFIAPVVPLHPLVVAATPEKSSARPRHRRVLYMLLVATAFCLAVIAAARWGTPARPVRFTQLTFARGRVSSARFTPDKQSIVYAAQWTEESQRFFQTERTGGASRPLGFEDQILASVSVAGELAILSGRGTMNIAGAMLSRVAINGGPAEPIEKNIFAADWSPDGRRLALVRVTPGAQQVEFPAGRVLYRAAGWIGGLRVSPAGDAVAFIDHPVRHDDAGVIKTVDIAGHAHALSTGWASAGGLAWKNAREIWFTATRDRTPRALWSVTTAGKLRAIGQAPGVLTLQDIASDGQVLLTLESRRLEMAGRMAGDTAERELSLTDWSRVQQLSSDGSAVLFDESGESSGAHPVSYLRRMRTGEVIRLGEGLAQGFSADERSALILGESRHLLTLAPLAGGPRSPLARSGLEYQWVRPFPSGDRLLALGNEPGHPLRLYVQSIASGQAEALTPPLMVRNVAISPDCSQIAWLTPEGELALYSTERRSVQVIPSTEPLAPLRWSRDGTWLYVQHLRSRTQSSADVSRIHPSSGALHPWKHLTPRDPTGVNAVTGVAIASDEQSYVYSYRRVLSELYVAEGWR